MNSSTGNLFGVNRLKSGLPHAHSSSSKFIMPLYPAMLESSVAAVFTNSLTFTANCGDKADTPFGSPSDVYIGATWRGHEVVFLPRHGRGHRLLPSEIPHRANIRRFRRHTGALDHQHQRRQLPSSMTTRRATSSCPTNSTDRTKGRAADTFFGDGIVAHVSFGEGG